MKDCPCDYCKFNGDKGCPKADAEEEIIELEKEIKELEESTSQ